MKQAAHTIKMTVSPAKFFILTYALSWSIWIPLALSHFGIGPLHIPEATSNVVRLLGVLMPAVAAIVLTAHSGGRSEVGALIRRLGTWRVGWQWWAAAVVVYPALLVISAFVYNRLIGSPPVVLASLTSIAALSITILFLLIATLGEEIGWRGVALPGLQRTRSALIASVLLGLGWGIWHLPFWLLLDTFDQFGMAYFGLNILFLFPITFYITWFHNHSHFSLLLPVVFHLTFNVVNTALLPVTIYPQAYKLFIVFIWVVAVLIVRHLEPGNREMGKRPDDALNAAIAPLARTERTD